MRLDPQPDVAPVLVTGANGIVGRAVVEALERQSIRTLAVLRPRSAPRPGALVLDLGAEGPNLSACLQTAPRAIVHLAAAVPHAVEYPDTHQTADITRRIDRAVAQAAERWHVPVVYASTCGLYDPLSPEFKTESSVCKVRSPYFAAKLDGERLFLEAAQSSVLRLSAIYGAGMRNTVVMSKFIESARDGRPIKLWGSGTREQDFIHATDVAACVVAALERPGAGILNVANGKPTSMRDLARTVVAAIGDAPIEFVDQPDPKDRETARYDIRRVEKKLNWAPRLPLGEGIKLLSAESFRS